MFAPIRRVVLVVPLLAVGGCAEPECRGTDVKYYDEALAFQLAKRGVRYQTSARVVCVSGWSAAEMRAAQADVDATFNEVARLLKDACEERAFAEWAGREGLRFDIRSTVDAQNRPSGRMFHLRSFTPEEVASNRAKLDGAPKGAACKSGPRKS